MIKKGDAFHQFQKVLARDKQLVEQNSTADINNSVSPIQQGLFRDSANYSFREFVTGVNINIFKFLNEGEKTEYLINELLSCPDKRFFVEPFVKWLNSDYNAVIYFRYFLKHFNEIETENLDINLVNNMVYIYSKSNVLSKTTDIAQAYSHIFGKDDVELVKAIQKIEGELQCTTEKLSGLGQYTSNSTLKFILPSLPNYGETQGEYVVEDNRSDNSEEKYLRLTNGNQLNDPMEGKFLFTLIDLRPGEKEYISTGNFVSSLTGENDNLPMWKQYGDDTRGVFTELSNEFLKEIRSFVYHTCYSTKEGDVLTISVPTLQEDKKQKVQESIEESLKQIKKIINGTDVKSERAIQYLDRLAFLFKRDEYAYEKEYRVLKNVTDSKKIKIEIHDNKYFIYHYLSDVPLSYSEIVLGPNNTQNLNYIGEYVKLLSPETKVNLSEIQYR